MRLTEAYMSLGIVDEAQTSAAVLGHNFPDSRWYKDAYSLVKSSGLEPTENKGSWISRAFRGLGLAPSTRAQAARVLESAGGPASELADLRIAPGPLPSPIAH